MIIKLLLIALTFSTMGGTWAMAENEANDTTIEKLQGRWQIVSGVNQGRELTESEVNGTYVTVTTNTIVTYDRDQQQRFRAVFRTDDTKSPIHITMTPVEVNASTDKLKSDDEPAQPVALGILKFLGEDQWMLCYGLPGADRPPKFESAKASNNMLFTLRKDEGDPVPDLSITNPAK